MDKLNGLQQSVRDALSRRAKRSSPSGLSFCLADSITHLQPAHWEALTGSASLFMSRDYRRLLEAHSPEGMQHRYALAYQDDRPVVAVAAQVIEIRGDQVANLRDSQVRKKALSGLRERVLVCGSLVSSGFHGVAFADDLAPELGWHALAEALYRIRRADRLHGQIDHVLIKDLDDAAGAAAEPLRQFSYRPMATAAEMVMPIRPHWRSHADYLTDLNTKYRSKARKLLREVEAAGFRVEPLADVAAEDAQLHALYAQVEGRAQTRLAMLPPGYFGALAQLAGPDRFRCTVIRDAQRIVGFMTMLRDGERALAYYVGFDYPTNERVPLYLRLLHSLIDDAIALGCTELSLGRTAMEPKASLGATARDSHVWLRHRVPVVNLLLRQILSRVEAEEAPQRTPFK